MKTIQTPWIKLKEHLNREDFDMINSLQEQCINTEKISLKLELSYKLATAFECSEKIGMKDINEFMYFDGQELIGYIGICSFGGLGTPFEVTGMVHPEYRRLGIFSTLNQLVLAECKRRNSSSILLLCDKKSDFGKNFIEKIGSEYKYSEYEMYLQENIPEPNEKLLCGISFRKANNKDVYEIARQNTIYFGDCALDDDLGLDTNSKDGILLPEDEEKRGMTIYLAELDKQIVGKVNLEMNSAIGGIYGLGILPEFRGNGFGRAVLLKAIEKLKEAKIKTIMLQVAAENATALGLYQSCGFIETSTMDYFELKI